MLPLVFKGVTKSNKKTCMLKGYIMKKLFLTAIFMILPVFAHAEIIKNIEVTGNKRVEPSTIISYLDLVKGEEYSNDKVSSSLKKMYETGLFADIKISMRNGSLLITIEENPVVNKIGFEGNKRVKDADILKEITLQSRSVYTRGKVQADVKRIQSLYRKTGRYSVDIEPKIVMLDQNRVDVVFEINEGKKTTVSKIFFTGNKVFDDSRLASEISTKQSRWYSFLSSNDTYDQDRIAYDKELLRKFYISKGYADFEVTSVSAEITPDKKSFIVTFNIEEGEKYKFGKVDIQSHIGDIPSSELMEQVQTEPDKTYNAELVDKTVDKLTTALNDKGYAFVEVNPEFDRDPDNRIMGVTYSINEGPKVYINRINIVGNVRTLDKVIRREFRIGEGDPFNAAKIRRSQQRIQNLGFFDKVDINNVRTDDEDKTDINVEVAERSTGELNFGAGFSTNDGALGNVSLRERNLLGRGQDLGISYEQSARTTQIDLSFTEPYFMDKDFSLGVNVFNTQTSNEDESSYESDALGGGLTGSYAITEDLRHILRYSYKTVDVTNIQPDASAYIRQQEGTTSTSLIGHSFVYDKRDNRFEPTDGYYIKISQDVAGAGGDSKFVRHEARADYFKPLWREDVVLILGAKAGNITGFGGEDVRINERFFIGGNIIRGFKVAGIGPRDITTRDALGAKNYYSGTTELSFPLGLPSELGFKGAAFLDFGSAFGTEDNGPTVFDSDAIRASAGVGIAWTSPIGPIRVDVAYPFAAEKYDRKQYVRFNFGTRF